MADPNLAPIDAHRTLRLREAAHEYSGEKLALWFHVDVNNPRCRWNGDYWEVHMGYPVGHCAIWYLSDEDLPKLPELGEPPTIPPKLIDHMQPVSPLTPEEQADYLAGKYTSYGTPPAHLAHLALTPEEQAYIDSALIKYRVTPERTPDEQAFIDAGAAQIAGAMLDAEDAAEESDDKHAIHHYTGGKDGVGLRVEVSIGDDESAARSPLDERDANRPYVPLTWRSGDGSEHYSAAIEFRDPSDNLIGTVQASELQVTYHYLPNRLPFPTVPWPTKDLPALEIEGIILNAAGIAAFEEMARDFAAQEAKRPLDLEGTQLEAVIQALLYGNPIPWLQARVDEVNAGRVARGEPPMPVIGRDFQPDPMPDTTCQLCGKITTDGKHEAILHKETGKLVTIVCHTRDSFMLRHEGFAWGEICPRCGRTILGGNHEVDSDDTADRRLIIRCKP